VSANDVPVITVALGLVSVMVIVEALLTNIVSGLKFFTAVGGASTVSVAEAALPGKVLAVVTAPVLFTYDPAAVAVTGTTMEQLPDAGIVPFDRASELPPLVMVTVPLQVLVDGVAAVFVMPEGYVSVKAAPETNVVLGLVSVMVMFVAPFVGIVFAL
jgi:hypothetical protein